MPRQWENFLNALAIVETPGNWGNSKLKSLFVMGTFLFLFEDFQILGKGKAQRLDFKTKLI